MTEPGPNHLLGEIRVAADHREDVKAERVRRAIFVGQLDTAGCDGAFEANLGEAVVASEAASGLTDTDRERDPAAAGAFA